MRAVQEKRRNSLLEYIIDKHIITSPSSNDPEEYGSDMF
jgi:hypothetical protein